MLSQKTHSKQFYMKIQGTNKNAIREAIAKQSNNINSQNISYQKNLVIDEFNSTTQNQGPIYQQKENINSQFRNTCYSRCMFNPTPSSNQNKKIILPYGQIPDRNLRSQSNGRPVINYKDNMAPDQNLYSMLDQFKISPQISMGQRPNLEKFSNSRLSECRRSRILSRQDNGNCAHRSEEFNKSVNLNQEQINSYKKTQINKFLEDMNTESNINNNLHQVNNMCNIHSTSNSSCKNSSNANRSNLIPQSSPVIIKNNINNLSVQITNGEGINTHLQFSQDNQNSQNMYTFKLNSQQQSPSQSNAKEAQQQLQQKENQEDKSTESQQQKRDAKLFTSTNERQSRICALQNIVLQQVNSTTNGGNSTNNTNNTNQNQPYMFNDNLKDIEVSEESLSKNLLNNNVQSTQNRNVRAKFYSKRQKTPLQPVRLFNQNTSFYKEPESRGNTNSEIHNLQQSKDSTATTTKSLQFGMGNYLDLEPQFDENMNVEEMHYYFVDFHQKSRDWMKKMDNQLGNQE